MDELVMKREIKFRAKSLNTLKWVYGDLRQCGKRKFVEYEVNPDTVGQFVGLYDNNGKEVYEHDYISINYKYDDIVNGCAVPDQDCICEGGSGLHGWICLLWLTPVQSGISNKPRIGRVPVYYYPSSPV